MAQGPTNLSLSGSKVARGTPDRVFVFYSFVLFFFLSNQKMFRMGFYYKS